MVKAPIIYTFKRLLIALTFLYTVVLSPFSSHAAEVLILGNTQLRPVSDVLNGIDQTLNYKKITKTPKEAKEDLIGIVNSEGSKIVIALGKEAVSIAQSLPESIPVIYGLLINPLETERKNITGVYMTTPVNEYLLILKKYFPGIRKIGIVCAYNSQKSFRHLSDTPEIKLCTAENPFEFIEGLNTLGRDVDALLLLPERKLITSTVIEQLYLFSFKEKKPVIGISEKYVKIGSLFSLGFDTTNMGRQLGELANKVLLTGSAADIPQSSPDKLNLYINRKTSETMRVEIPVELMKSAKKVYP